MLIDPGDLLAKHHYLLEEDFHELEASTSGIQKHWVYSVEEAVKVTDHLKSGKQHWSNSRGFTLPKTYANICQDPWSSSYVYWQWQGEGKTMLGEVKGFHCSTSHLGKASEVEGFH